MNKEKPWFCQDCRVLMEWKDDICYRCPECRTEVWLPDKTIQVVQGSEDIGELMMPEHIKVKGSEDIGELMMPEHIKVKGGGKRSGVTSNKQKLKEPSQHKLFTNLCR